jgi:hypothetical protein
VTCGSSQHLEAAHIVAHGAPPSDVDSGKIYDTWDTVNGIMMCKTCHRW